MKITQQGGKTVLWVIAKIAGALTCLYFFICSLEFLSTSFRLLAGKQAGEVFSQSELLQNPIVGLMLGILVTVLLQSSSTTTSIIVGMVAGNILNVRQAIPMVMGANIGTSVTNTIVSIAQIGDRDEFRLAFAAATVHDIFNWLTVIVLLIVEVISGYLYELTHAIVSTIKTTRQEEPPDLLKPILKPFTELIIQIDKKVLEAWSSGLNDTKYENVTSLLKENCKRNVSIDLIAPLGSAIGEQADPVYVIETYQCGYVFANSGLADVWVGLILLIISLAMLSGCLVMLVKILNSMMKDKMAEFIKTTLNSDIPYVPWLTGYLAMAIGAIITFLVQSSSVFTSTLTPLVGTGIFSLERAYALTLGANIGTTTTGILAAMASDGDHLTQTLQIALCHLFFNVTGILLYYPIPFMRWPIPLAKIMGNTVAKYRWFALFYLLMMFFLIPLYIFGLSLAGPVAMYIGLVPIGLITFVVVIINLLQNKIPEKLPPKLQNWDFLPLWMRSLDPLDKLIPTPNCGPCKSLPNDAAADRSGDMIIEMGTKGDKKESEAAFSHL